VWCEVGQQVCRRCRHRRAAGGQAEQQARGGASAGAGRQWQNVAGRRASRQVAVRRQAEPQSERGGGRPQQHGRHIPGAGGPPGAVVGIPGESQVQTQAVPQVVTQVRQNPR